MVISIKKSSRTRSPFLVSNSLNRSFLFQKRIFRKYPLLNSIDKSIDGAILGVVFSASLMSALALHSQHLWTINFSALSSTRSLINKLEESTIILERYLLDSVVSPDSLVQTETSHLFYIKPQDQANKQPLKLTNKQWFANTFFLNPIVRGY